MSSLPVGPVAWSDGMLIETQHFQQQERYLSHQVASRLEQTVNHGWGFTLLEVDQDGLGLGRLGLRGARGVFQDGTAFSVPSYDPLPAPLETTQAQAGDVACLAVQAARSGGPEMAFGDVASASRFRVTATEVPDLAVGLDASGTPRNLTIETGRLMIRLCWKSELRSNEVALPIARVEGRSASGTLLVDSRFVPPLLDIRAHIVLNSLIDELQSTLRVRLASTASQRVLSAGGGIADLIELLLRQAIAEYRMRLANLDAFHPLPPVLLYRELIGLLGRLSVLPGVDDDLANRKFNYRHDDLQGSFEPLAETLRRALARVIETPVLPLRFEDRGDQVHICIVDKQWKLKKLVFAVSAAMPADKLRQLLPQQTKLGAVEQIQKLVDLQLPGARLIPLPNPPHQIPYYAQSIYFEVESSDPFWAQTIAGSAMALRIVGEFPDLSFEAWGLRDGKAA
ncbi:type VI secretion protein [Burkholderia cepacia]|uniref:type VI secretion system baseplate subunit TssK n=1 Tax=Burkholderia cepacia TaxID=292 RepID=UPI0007596E62|nr:type VI secretion system baseplate subunit TssK [Burkholderia cepacia]KVS53631.1 type VI secretion protein [Burkholderia cepacia]KVS58978.1 type VI secretion protein [Burkholderia cepacia]RQT71877.1 type VI secretion system baseplate subunit TssK [Burkholderia cepacia]RQT92291.1 type VI secretion system baseplate subunit TssK [Burkholderia cepacia]RQZ68907.1 type VI secretion system baseplate subunit TssK [Burkholderia cepacia]